MAKDNRDHVSSGRAAGSAGTLVHTKDVDDFKIPDGQPDPRGWDVRSSDGSKVGKVEDLLFDTGERRVRYVEVAVDRDIAKQTGRDYMLLPIGQARLDDADDNVIVDVSSTELAGAPVYDRTRLSRDYETSLQSWVRERKSDVKAAVRGDARSDHDLGFYASPEYDDQQFFSRGTRGGVREGTGASDRARASGIADRLTDAADNLKDRVDGNPASRPGPDTTDRRI